MDQQKIHREVNVSNEKPLIIYDDINNKMGYFMGTAKYVTPEKINFMIKIGRGLVYVCITEEQARQLDLHPMTNNGNKNSDINFTVSVDFKTTTTGISAYERADTIKAFTDIQTGSLDFKKPGHVFPVVGKPNGLLDRQGIVEGVLELSSMISGQPMGYMCEILNQYGEVASRKEIEQISSLHDVPIINLSDIIQRKYEDQVWLNLVSHTEREISNKRVKIYQFENKLFSSEFTVFIRSNQPGDREPVYYESCHLGDLLGISNACSCKEHFRDYFQHLLKGKVHCLIYHQLNSKTDIDEMKLSLIKQQMQKMIKNIQEKKQLKIMRTPNYQFAPESFHKLLYK